MTALRVAQEPEESPDDAVTVAVAARRLGCDPTTVRALLRAKRLSGHRVGKGDDPGGVRVHVSSIAAYKERHALGGIVESDGGSTSPKPKKARVNAAHNEAMATLRAMGVRV